MEELINEYKDRMRWNDQTIISVLCDYIGHQNECLSTTAMKFENYIEWRAAWADKEEIEERCRYCGGSCPSEPNDADDMCDGYAGDIDGLYKEEEDNG